MAKSFQFNATSLGYLWLVLDVENSKNYFAYKLGLRFTFLDETFFKPKF